MADQKKTSIITGNLNEAFEMSKRGESYNRPAGIPKSSRFLGRPVLGGVYDGLSEETSKAIRRTGVNVQYTSPEIRNPLLNIVNFYLPTNYKILNQWIRYYDRFHPIVGNCIDMHAEFPISQFELEGIDDKKVLNMFEDAALDMDLFQRFIEISREYELLGEVYPFAHWSDEKNYFDEIVLLNPDFVAINASPFAYGSSMQFELEPDEELKRLVHSTDEKDLEMKQFLDPVVLRCVDTGRNIPIDGFNIAQIARKASPYDVRGTSIILRCLKDLLYEDKLREAQYAIADGHITPKQIWKLGDPQNGYMPSDDDLADFQKTLQAAAHDPMFAIITHYGLQLDLVGATGKILPIIPEFEFISDRILTALYTSRAAIHGEGPSWTSGPVIAFEILQGRYMAKREKLENWLTQKIWIPMALANGFYKPVESQLAHRIRVAGKERELILPKIHWKQKLELVDDNQKKQYMDMARQRLDVSYSSWCKIMGIDESVELDQLKKEKGTLADPNYKKRQVQLDDLNFQKELKKQGLLPPDQPSVMPGQGQLALPGFGAPGASGGGQSGTGTKPAPKPPAPKQGHVFGSSDDRIRAVKKSEMMEAQHVATKEQREEALVALSSFEKELDVALAGLE